MENQNRAGLPKKKKISDLMAFVIGVAILVGALILLKYGMKALNLL